MTIFAEKLATLVDTVRVGESGPIHAIVEALLASADRPTIAIGSGGSAIMAEYFARCRSTLGHGPTLVQTPMEFVVSEADFAGHDVWLFSAGADNPDTAASFETAIASNARSTVLLTVNPDGRTTLAASASKGRARAIVAPVAERKDGFLATHSLVAMATCVLAASDVIASGASPRTSVARLCDEVDRIARDPASSALDFRACDTVVILHDPQCRTLATLIETSLWETAIAPVQRADFRNFAHGRHVWAARKPDSMFILALTATTSRGIWSGIRQALPAEVRMAQIDLAHAGRFRSAASIAEGLQLLRIMGIAAGVDPAKPGRGEFAGAIYGDEGLLHLSRSLDPAVRHKMDAIQRHDDRDCTLESAVVVHGEWLDALRDARLGGIVLDYDGTLVETDARLAPPVKELVGEITRLLDGGMAVGFATGRGGSAGDALREALPERHHRKVLVGYYNGGHIRSLDVTIDHDGPVADEALAEAGDWIDGRDLLVAGTELKRGAVQITIPHASIRSPAAFASAMADLPPVKDGRVKVVSSHHSFDLLPAHTSKMSVVAMLRSRMPEDLQVLAIGDSGEPGGNDAELLSQHPSISVDGVCGRVAGCWSLFGREARGPAALLRILRAVQVNDGSGRIDLSTLAPPSS